MVTDEDGDRVFNLQRLTLSGKGGGEGNVTIEIPVEYTANSLVVRVMSDGWRGVDVEKTVPWKVTESVTDKVDNP